MKLLRSVFALLVLCAVAFPQTEDQGMGAFSNNKTPIMLAVDASLVNLNLKSPYVMFVMYMASKEENQNIEVHRDGVAMLYNGQEYKMPSYKELQKNYKGGIKDITLYRHLGKEGIVSSWMRFYDFPASGDFFPPLTLNAQLITDQGSMYNFTGFRTKLYFKNPGFKKGDKLVIKVTAKNKPELTGEVEVTLK
jgi:hypothetical protein